MHTRGFTILEFLLVSLLAAGLLTAALPLLQDLRNLLAQQTKLSELLTRAQLLYSVLSRAGRSAGATDCVLETAQPSLAVAERSLIHDSSLASQNNILLLSGCDIYNSQQHWLQTAYFIARSSASKIPALYTKIISIDNLPVSLPKIEQISGVASLHFAGCSFKSGLWGCKHTINSADVVVADVKMQAGRVRHIATQDASELPLFVDQNNMLTLRASWAIGSEVK